MKLIYVGKFAGLIELLKELKETHGPDATLADVLSKKC